MSIITRQGDAGKTRLGGREVPKDDPRLEALGDGDELLAALAEIPMRTRSREARDGISRVQRQLRQLLTEIAGMPAKHESGAEPLHDRDQEDLTERCLLLERQLRPRPEFLDFTHDTAWALNRTRTLARRFERRLATLFHGGRFENRAAMAWANRLSDYLWLLALLEERSHGRKRTAFALNLSR